MSFNIARWREQFVELSADTSATSGGRMQNQSDADLFARDMLGNWDGAYGNPSLEEYQGMVRSIFELLQERGFTITNRTCVKILVMWFRENGPGSRFDSFCRIFADTTGGDFNKLSRRLR